MRDKVVGLSEVLGVKAIRLERREGRRHVVVNEFGPQAGLVAFNSAVEDAGGSGGLYRASAIDASGNLLATHRFEIPADEDMRETTEQTFIRYVTQQNNMLLTLITELASSNMARPTAAPSDPNGDSAIFNALGGAITSYLMANKQAELAAAGAQEASPVVPVAVDATPEQMRVLAAQLSPEQIAQFTAIAAEVHASPSVEPDVKRRTSKRGRSGKVGAAGTNG